MKYLHNVQHEQIRAQTKRELCLPNTASWDDQTPMESSTLLPYKYINDENITWEKNTFQQLEHIIFYKYLHEPKFVMNVLNQTGINIAQ